MLDGYTDIYVTVWSPTVSVWPKNDPHMSTWSQEQSHAHASWLTAAEIPWEGRHSALCLLPAWCYDYEETGPFVRGTTQQQVLHWPQRWILRSTTSIIKCGVFLSCSGCRGLWRQQRQACAKNREDHESFNLPRARWRRSRRRRGDCRLKCGSQTTLWQFRTASLYIHRWKCGLQAFAVSHPCCRDLKGGSSWSRFAGTTVTVRVDLASEMSRSSDAVCGRTALTPMMQCIISCVI